MKKLFNKKLLFSVILALIAVFSLTGCNINNRPDTGASKSNVFIKNSNTPSQSIDFDVVTVEKLNAITEAKAESDLSQYVDLKKVIARIRKSSVRVLVNLADGKQNSGSGTVVSCVQNKTESDKTQSNSSASKSDSADVAQTDSAAYTSYIVTCHHVIENAVSVGIITDDGLKLSAYLVGSDPDSDICVMSVQAKLDPVEFFNDNSNLQIGEKVLAMGYPLGNDSVVATSGIISCASQQYAVGAEKYNLLLTDAVINRGNTGGGLFTETGLYVGMINASLDSIISTDGLSFAMEGATLREVCEQLVSTSTAENPGYIKGKYRLGVTVKDVDSNRWGSKTYVAVTAIEAGGCFDKAGFNIDDELVSYTYRDKQTTIAKADTLLDELKELNLQIGDTLTFRVNRKGTIVALTVTISQFIYGQQ